jgi:arylsulfatase B
MMVGVLAVLGFSTDPVLADRPPNIVLVVIDDVGYAEMGCQGGDIPTPRIDELARRGVRCTAGYVTAPYCSPSRAALLTGRYQQRFGHELNPVGEMNDRPGVGPPESERTIGDYLKAAGYATGAVGKWHLGAHPPHHPLGRGFSEFFGFLREGHFYVPPAPGRSSPAVVAHLRTPEPAYNRLNPILRGEAIVEEAEYLTAAFARESVDFIHRNRETPFFLYLAFNASHSPMQARKADFDRFGSIADSHRRVWAAMMAALDEAVGRVQDELRRCGLERETLVVFLSDNGGPTAELTSRNAPFSGGKGTMLEGGIRVPFLLSWPGHLPEGTTYDEPVSTLDVLPTVLSAAGLPVPVGVELDGVDLVPFLSSRDRSPPHAALFWRMGQGRAIRFDRWKLLRSRDREPFRLHDLVLDPAEQHDLAARRPQLVRELSVLLQDWEDQMIPPRW